MSMVHGFDPDPALSQHAHRDNLLSKVGQLIYRFQACNPGSPNTALLGYLQMAELSQLAREHCRYQSQSPEGVSSLFGLEVRELNESDACQVALLGHKD